MVLNKPAGLAAQGGKDVEVSLDAILAKEFSPRPLLVHRLDQDTSGLILAAKNREAAACFARLFAGEKGRSVIKRYLAVCAGSPDPSVGVVRAELPVRGAARASETAYRLLETRWDFSLIELELGTGRTHQIRRHLAHICCPVLGDDKYGDFALNRRLRKERGLKRLLLHASRLIISGFSIDVTAPLPDYFEEFWASSLIS